MVNRGATTAMRGPDRFRPMATGRSLLLAGILLSTGLAGCIGSADDLAQQSTADLDRLVGEILALKEGGGFALDVPVDIFLFGFDEGFGDALAERLSPEEVFHAHSSFTSTLPPDPEDPQPPLLQGHSFDMPHVPTAVYDVVQFDAAVTAALFGAVKASPVESQFPAIYDANAAEEHLARTLPGLGYPLDPRRPALVLLHAEDHLPDGHAWRYTLPQGYLEPVRNFGERVPLVIHDTSAREDPYVVGDGPSLSPLGLVFGTVFGPPEAKGYNHPMAPGGSETLALVEELVRDATHHRLLQGAIYPISTKPCHHVTLLTAVHQSSVTEVLPGHARAEEWVDAEALQESFVNLTGDEVLVDTVWLTLPQDDPALDALMRGAASFVTLDALRLYLDLNWEKFVDVREGCEEYLSLMLYADPASEFGRLFGGIGMYDVKMDRRISYSIVTDVRRIRDAYTGPGEEVVATGSPSRDPNWVNLLFAHETGHLFGQHHPQHLQKARDPSPAIDTFQSAWTTMSYQTGDRIIDFGKIDKANWQRNRAGYAVLKAQVLGLEESPAFSQARRSLVAYDWAAVQAALEEGIQEADREHTVGRAFFGGHDHTW